MQRVQTFMLSWNTRGEGSRFFLRSACCRSFFSFLHEREEGAGLGRTMACGPRGSRVRVQEEQGAPGAREGA